MTDFFGLLFVTVLVIFILIALLEALRRLFYASHWDFFVSHRSTDNKTVIPIVTTLRKRNFRIWIDLLEINEGQAKAGLFRFPISIGIQGSSFALLFTSEEYCKSDFCRQEASFFIKRFAREPQRIIEIRLDKNKARKLLNIPPASVCIDLEQFKPSEDKEVRYSALVDELISQTGIAGVK